MIMIGRNGVEVMTTRELFDFVTRHTLKEEEYDAYIERVGDSTIASYSSRLNTRVR